MKAQQRTHIFHTFLGHFMSETEDFMQEIHKESVGRHFVGVGCEFHLWGNILQACKMFDKR